MHWLASFSTFIPSKPKAYIECHSKPVFPPTPSYFSTCQSFLEMPTKTQEVCFTDLGIVQAHQADNQD
jgi:hypothetical protein